MRGIKGHFRYFVCGREDMEIYNERDSGMRRGKRKRKRKKEECIEGMVRGSILADGDARAIP